MSYNNYKHQAVLGKEWDQFQRYERNNYLQNLAESQFVLGTISILHT